MEAEQHLPPRSTVKENQRRPPLTGLQLRWKKQLAVNLHAVGGRQHDGLRLNKRGVGEAGGHLNGLEVLEFTAAGLHCGMAGRFPIGTEHGKAMAVAQLNWFPFEPFAGRQCGSLLAENGHSPDVPAVNIILIR